MKLIKNIIGVIMMLFTTFSLAIVIFVFLIILSKLCYEIGLNGLFASLFNVSFTFLCLTMIEYPLNKVYSWFWKEDKEC